MSAAGKFTRQLLSDYRAQLRLYRAQESLIEAMEKASPLPSPSSNGLPSSTSAGSPLERRIMRLEDEREMLHQRAILLEWRASVVRSYLMGVSDPLARTILTQRYVYGWSWKAIAVTHGAGASESAMRMLAVRYTDKHPITWISRG